MAGSGNTFVEAVCATHKGKTITRTIGPPTKRAYPVEEVIILSPPASQSMAKESFHLQSESLP